MGTIVLDKNIINKYVMNDFEEYFQEMEESLEIITKLQNTLPNDFTQNAEISNLSFELKTLKENIKNVKDTINEKLDKNSLIEKNIESKNSEIVKAAQKLTTGAIISATGAVSSKSTSSRINSNTIGANVSTSKGVVTSKVKEFFGNIADGFKKIGSKISTGFKSIKSWVSEKKQVVSDILSVTFNHLKETDVGKVLAKTGAKIASAVSTAKEVVGDWISSAVKTLKKVGASIANVAISFVKGVVSLVEALVNLVVIIGGGVATIGTGLVDIGKGTFTGNWDWSTTKGLWTGVRTIVSYGWTNKLAEAFYNTSVGKSLDEYAYKPFKSTGTACKISEGVGYIAGLIALTIATCGIGAAASGGAAAGATAASVASTSVATISVGSMSATVTTGSLVSAGIAAGAGIGKNTASAWNDGASTINGLLYGVAKGTYEGFEMGLGYTIGSLKVVKGASMAAKLTNAASHVVLDAADGASGALVDPLFSMIYSPNAKNVEEIMKFVNYDANGNKINDKAWDDLSFTEKYNAIFQYKGGWNTVATQAAMAGSMSALSELPDIASALKKTNIIKTTNTKAIIKSPKNKISKLKGASLDAFLKQCEKNNDIDQITKYLSTDQIKKSINILDEISLEKVFKNLEESQIEKLLVDSPEYTLKRLGVGKIQQSLENLLDTPNAKNIVSKLSDNDVLYIIGSWFNNEDKFTKFVSSLDRQQATNLVDNILIRNNSIMLGKILNKLDLTVVKEFIDKNLIEYNSNLSTDIKSLIFNNINQKHEAFFSKYNTGKGLYGVDQNATRKYVTYDIKKNLIDDIEDFTNYITTIDKDIDINIARKIATRLSNENIKISIDDFEMISRYFSEYKNYDTATIWSLLDDNYVRQEAPIYIKMKKKLISQGLDAAEATKVLDLIDSDGICSYAAVANIIMESYKDIPELFKRDFGFELYTDIDGIKTLNSTELLVDMYTYLNSDICFGNLFKYTDGKLSINDLTLKEKKLSGFTNYNTTSIDSYLKSKNKNIEFKGMGWAFEYKDEEALSIEGIKTYITQKLQNGEYVGLGIYRTQKKYNFIDENGKISLTTHDWNEGAGHAVHVTGLTDEGVIVSTWGNKNIIRFEDMVDNQLVIRTTTIGGIT